MQARTIVVLTLTALSCSAPSASDPGSSGGTVLEPRSTSEGLTLTNPTDRTVYYAVFERKWVETGLFIWAQCTDAPRCPAIPPRGTVHVPVSDISGYTSEAREARVYYWLLVPEGKGKHRVADLQSVVVPL